MNAEHTTMGPSNDLPRYGALCTPALARYDINGIAPVHFPAPSCVFWYVVESCWQKNLKINTPAKTGVFFLYGRKSSQKKTPQVFRSHFPSILELWMNANQRG